MAVSLWLLVSFLVVLLALPVAIVIAAWAHRTSRAKFPRSSPPRTDNPPAEGADAGPDLPEPAPGPPASPPPHRVAGQSGVAYPAGDPAHPPGVSRPPQASGSPPWGPAPKPPGAPERIKRLGWDKARGERRSQGPGRTLTLPALPRHPSSRSPARAAASARRTDIPRPVTGRSGALAPSSAQRGRAHSRTDSMTRVPGPRMSALAVLRIRPPARSQTSAIPLVEHALDRKHQESRTRSDPRSGLPPVTVPLGS